MAHQRGGNGAVNINNGIARKYLLKGVSKGKVERFKTEIEILSILKKEKHLSNIIEIIDFNLSTPPYWYSMKAYSGDSNDLLPYTKGNINETVTLLIPIVETLRKLSEIATPIFHRDLKPDNILYQNVDGRHELILADFGCAFLKTDDTNRLTNEFRAVGPMAYRAPEYHHGRVDTVNEKGDIFSLGKIIWNLINGIKGEVFPYTLWFPAEYNLSRRFPNLLGVEKLNLLIAAMVHHNPNERIGYPQIEESLKDIVLTINAEEKSGAKEQMLAFEANRRIVLEERINITSNMILLFERDVKNALLQMKKRHPQSKIIKNIYESFKVMYPENVIIDSVVLNEADTPLWNHSQASLSIQSRIFPVQYSTITKIPTKFPLVQLAINVTNSSANEKHLELWWYFSFESAACQKNNGKLSVHNNRACSEIFEQAIEYMSA
jgi:serine/threonine protein kinase